LDATEVQSVHGIAVGKAAMAMAGVFEQRLKRPIQRGMAVVPHDYPDHFPSYLPEPAEIEVVEAGHPVPDAASLEAGRRMRDIATNCEAGDTLIVLISGGGSALAVDVPEALSLEQVQQTVNKLLRSGAPIHATNTVRKHLSRIKGGQLARAAAPATVHALVVSDVVGDDLSTIASGLTVPDPTTFADALTALHTHGVWSDVPAAVRRYLTAGQNGDIDETPKPGSPVFDHVTTQLIGTNRTALEAAAQAAQERGYEPHVMASDVTGEAREVAPDHVEALAAHDETQPVCCLWGGEPTVKVTGGGTGGRNQEAALAAALALDGWDRPAVFLAGGTDGIDGPTDAAGAWATPATVQQAQKQGLDPREHLDTNNAYPFFDALDQLLRSGPTHTNVMDVHIGLVVNPDM
jgi:hydroxypyruvate reductase